MITAYITQSREQLASYFSTDVDMVEAVDYYTRPFGGQPDLCNWLNEVGTSAAFTWDAFHCADEQLPLPLQIIVGPGQAGALGSYRNGFELFNTARSEKKNILVVPGATHYDRYDQAEPVGKAIEKLEDSDGENL